MKHLFSTLLLLSLLSLSGCAVDEEKGLCSHLGMCSGKGSGGGDD